MSTWETFRPKFMGKSVRAVADRGVVYISRKMARRLLRTGAARVLSERPFTIRFVEQISRRGCQLLGDRRHRHHREEVLAAVAWAREAKRRNLVSAAYRRLMREVRENRETWEELYDAGKEQKRGNGNRKKR